MKITISKNAQFFALLIFGAVAAMLLFNGNCNHIEKPAIVTVKEQKKELQKVKEQVNNSIDSIVLESGNIQKAFAPVVKGLKKSQAITKKIIDTLKQDNASEYFSPGIVDRIDQSTTTSDSLCEAALNNLQEQITNQAQIIHLKDAFIDSMQVAIDKGIEQQQLLTAYSKKLEQKVRWNNIKKFGWKVAAVTGGLFILKSVIK